ncbi:MAG: ABC transporter substrate-binding protein [Deltaproteobacteria bacterium]|nr:ABC transporter substrate-binding protein [Deltaproteobacteria bacterium]MBW1847123.1 ABC transporter substrate-binding protein [Deltaproteobacteria bacterium]MBW1983203.1 ABC transporter substrate-binding protein [Deltaproteobacteria bacterium]MBW2179062.1 ABC transporter substrate-binding protein [Deltaproteobacteria bacterium]MBW2364030.1 ABC transporter substrate-binding protein [Deltaproteobacteria bacterium]
MKYKFFLKLILLAFVLLFFSGSAAVAQKKVLRVGLYTDPETINPFEFKTWNELPVTGNITPGLMGPANPDTGLRRMSLAESVEILENGKDILIKLKKGYKFHTGDPLTPEDIKFSVEQTQMPDNANVYAGIFSEISQVEIVDEHTLIYRFEEPFAPWQDTMWMGVSSKNYYENVGKEKFRSHPVGCGPFQFKERKRGEYITLETVKNHAEYKPDFNEIRFLIVPDPITRLAMLETKELDLIYNVLPHQVAELKRHPHIKIKKAQVPSLYYLSIKPSFFPELKDRKVRMAISYAINRRQIVDKVFFKQGYPLYTWANKGEIGYDPGFKIEYNLEKARKLLKESNYEHGTPLVITYTSVMPNAPIVATILQKYMKNIGINAMITQLEYGTYLTYARNKDPRAGHMALSAFAVDQDPNAHLALGMGSTSTYCYYTDRPNQEEMDKLIAAQNKETNMGKRLEILKQIHAINNSDPGSISLFGLYEIYAMNRRIDYTWISGGIYPAYLYKTKLIK